MIQRYHVLLRRPDDRVLASNQPLGWLLPIVAADARARAPHVVSRFIERLNIQGTVACVTSGMVDRQASGIDWLAVVDGGHCGSAASLGETTVDTLLESPALLPVQSELLRAFRGLSATTESPLSPGWLTDATTWASRCFPDCGRIDPVEVIPHRTALFEGTWEFRQAATSLFLKWCGRGSFLDPDLARIAARYGGARVPNTVAYDRARRWWLTDRVRGAPLTAHLSPVAAARVAQGMAAVQMNLLSADWRLRSIGVPEESLTDLAAQADRILSCQSNARGVRSARAAIHRACAELEALRLPATWIHTDFLPENVFIDNDDVYFIDLEDPWIGPAPVVMEFLYAGFRRHVTTVPARSAIVSSACESFVNAWRAMVGPEVMHRSFAATRLVAEVLRISRRLRAIAVREEHGELAGLTEPATRESARRLVALANGEPTGSQTRST